jgi:hypothetical protein
MAFGQTPAPSSIASACTLFSESTRGVLIRALLRCRQVAVAVHTRTGKRRFEESDRSLRLTLG